MIVTCEYNNFNPREVLKHDVCVSVDTKDKKPNSFS